MNCETLFVRRFKKFYSIDIMENLLTKECFFYINSKAENRILTREITEVQAQKLIYLKTFNEEKFYSCVSNLIDFKFIDSFGYPRLYIYDKKTNEPITFTLLSKEEYELYK